MSFAYGSDSSGSSTDKRNISVLIVISLLALGFLVWLIYFGPENKGFLSETTIKMLPTVNAALNSLSTIFLMLGYFFIKGKNRNEKAHRNMMISAFTTSSLFLVSYLVYHYAHGDTKFINTGFIKYSYFFILISHIVLSGIALPLIFITLYFITVGNRAKHMKFARITFPIWLYVSVSGVLVYWYLKNYNLGIS